MKASYFSAQSLGWLGAAFNPMLTGLILTHLPHWSLLSFLSWRLSPPADDFPRDQCPPRQPDSPLANA